jgi:galactokinase
MVDPEDLAHEFEHEFGRTPRIYRAPGRVNLIGEHTDYNDGFVMPMALDRSTWVAAAARADDTIVVRSREYDETVTLHRDAAVDRHVGPAWHRYVRGVARVLDVAGADMLIASDVPIGAGLSSSAALEVACGYALLDLAGRPIHLIELAGACQRAEHEYAGTRCGVMDQMIACHGREGHALMLDTRTLERRWLPLPSTVRVLVCNTMVTHQLASGEYNARRADCEAGVRVLARRCARIRALRDATLAGLDAVRGELSDSIYRRCRHVIAENARVEDAARALAAGDFAAFGRLMDESHGSLRDDYEVSCAELDAMVAIARGLDGVFGARMTGGGFGGCAIALVDASAVDRASREIKERYETATGLRPEVWVSSAGAGVTEWPLHLALHEGGPLHHGGHGRHGGQNL